jgi:arabinosaccharide transport system substrate-binding protein
MKAFPFGRAAFWIMTLALAAGAIKTTWGARQYLSSRGENSTKTITFWVFAPEHVDAYKSAFPAFEKKHPGIKIDLQQVTWNVVTQRLQAAVWSGVALPDVVEIPIDSAGAYFRGPVEDVGFVDLTERIKKAGLLNEMVTTRFAPYSTRGHIFGLPHDVHPMMLAYNAEVFKKEGVDVEKIETWDDFIAVGRRLTKLTKPGERYMLELEDGRTAHFDPCLLQRGGGHFDAKGNVIFDNEIGIQTMLWFVPLVAGEKRIAGSLAGGQVSGAVKEGYFLCLMTPDWRTKTIEKYYQDKKTKQFDPEMMGKLKLMPLPAVQRGGRRTSTWGGTMLGITKQSPHQDLAWQLALHLYLNKADLGQRFRETNILPALRTAWKEPAFNEPRAFWGGQRLGKMYADLAPSLPEVNTSPFITQSRAKLGEALVDCVSKYRADGNKGFEPYVRARVKRSADELRALIARNPF